jgi:DNA replication initiation complex subunit (GINS family)
LPEDMYEKITEIWLAEVQNENLQDLGDLRLTELAKHLSNVRHALTETESSDDLQAEIYTQEILNLEFMLRDMLMHRRSKIIRAAIEQKRPLGTMVLSEEDLFNRLSREIEKHLGFVEETLAGFPQTTMKREGKKSRSKSEESEETDYVLVKFQRPIDDAFLGIDEATYGPFKKEDIATIPAYNAKTWLQNGTVVKVITDRGGT